RGEAALRLAAARVAMPRDIAALVETNREALGGVFLAAERPPARLRARPAEVVRALAVAGLASDADLRPGRGEAVVRRLVVLDDPGRVALGAHEVPVLIQSGPVQHVVVLDLLVPVGMEPALAALLFRARVPGDREHLQAAVGKFDEILLQRIDAEGVFDLERRELAVRPVGLDQELAVAAEKAGTHAVV